MKRLFILLTAASLWSCNTENKQEESIDPEVITTEVEKDDEASNDLLKFDTSKTDLKWSAYKTPEKVAVHGTFDSIVVKNTSESLIPEEVLEGATFTIYTETLKTGDVSRDAKIVGLFFNNLENNIITGSFGKFDNEVVPVELVMNGKKVVKDFQYTFENKKIIITGVVDVLQDFQANKAFDILHEACSALHMQKTWTDVSIEIISNLDASDS